MNVEEGMAALFERATMDLEPRVEAMAGAGERLGRRLRTRRRVRMVVGSTAAVAVVAAGVAVGFHQAQPPPISGLSGVGHETSPPAAPSLAPAPAAPPAPGPKSSTAATPTYSQPVASRSATMRAPAQMTLQDMLDALRRLLPAGAVLTHPTANPYAAEWLEVDYNDGKGAVDIIVVVSPGKAPNPATVCPNPLWKDEGIRPKGALPISCQMRTLPDGSGERDAVNYADSAGFYGYSVYVERRDGVEVLIQVGNGINHTTPQVDRAVPPGTMAQWAAIAENPVWH
jgi:hypothetical protein